MHADKAHEQPNSNLQPDEIIRRYVELVRNHPGHIKVWAKITGPAVQFLTLIQDTTEAERAVYKAESILLRSVPPELVSFELFRTSSPSASPAGSGVDDSQLVLAA